MEHNHERIQEHDRRVEEAKSKDSEGNARCNQSLVIFEACNEAKAGDRSESNTGR